ncbi:hypothetical protein MYCTH_2113081 [Thermothelomyces thermophilus ATCC 42464]|uniref:Uncharacterized protein n=1 Tax=Thermothelomyces thermophilus (strain ATCC 42464 / BCRC 31852 / DSM 1799) TaxID=573729 RepID=G2QMD2_THET4|nr:uncharacterized protein MYCTH_2113081 [Thermothelomyces thermophilus ATCC 42464]AEO61112.1 hypothetical protein MYCTH_2113081 [Thermothelomyces thermophilus ATCC 42464]
MANLKTNYDCIPRNPSIHAETKSSLGFSGAGSSVSPANSAIKEGEVDRINRIYKKGLEKYDERFKSDEAQDADDLSPILGPFSSPWEGAEHWKMHHLRTSIMPFQQHDDADRATAFLERRRLPKGHDSLPATALPLTGAFSSAGSSNLSIDSGDDDTSDSEGYGRPLLPFLRRLELIERHLHGVLALEPAGTEGVKSPKEGAAPAMAGEELDRPADLTRSLRALGARAHPIEHAVAIRFVEAPKPLEVEIHAVPASPEMGPVFDEENWGSSYPGLK